MTEIAIRKPGPQPGTGSPRRSLETAKAAWGELPDWLEVLALACDRTSQSVVARRLNYSVSVISTVIGNNYKGSTKTVEQMVRGKLMSETRDCPVLGDIQINLCLDHQKKARHFQPTSSMRVSLYRACRGSCPHSRLPNAIDDGAANA